MKFLVADKDGGKRLDIFLSMKIKHLTRSNIKKLINSTLKWPGLSGLDLAKTVLKLISNDTINTLPILHYANKGICNWKEFAEAIVNESGNKTQVIGVSTSDYPTLAKRPKYSILDTERIEKKLGINIPTWQESLKKCVQILKSDGSL